MALLFERVLLVCLLLITFSCWSISCLELRVLPPSQNTLGNDGDFIPLKGNWLNLSQISAFKFIVQPRNDGLKMDILSHGFIKRDNSIKRNPYQIYSKTVVLDVQKSINISHFFDSNMEQYSSESCSNRSSCSSLPESIQSNIPFHQIMNAYEQNSYLAKEHVKFYDRVTDDLCRVDENDLIVTSFNQQHFLICVEKGKREVGAVRFIVGREFIAKVVSFSSSTWEQLSEMFKRDGHRFPKKKKVTSTSGSVEKQRELMEIQNNAPQSAYFFNPDAHVCLLPWLKGSNCDNTTLLTSSKRSIRTMKRCVFLHGYGTEPKHTGFPVYTSSEFRNGEYWGKVDRYTPYCSQRIFMREETNQRGWDDFDLQLAVSRILVPSFQFNTSNIVRDTIIFAHSMGNLMIAGAIRQGLISIDRTTTTWYNIMGPILGSPLADFGANLCSSDAYEKGIEFGLCVSYGMPTKAIQSLRTSDILRDEISPIVSRYVTGTMCGTKSSGLYPLTPMNQFMALISSTIMSRWTHDGAVPTYSCRNTLNYETLSENYRSTNYRVSVNHFDGTCANGDGWFDSTSPCSYYLNKY